MNDNVIPLRRAGDPPLPDVRMNPLVPKTLSAQIVLGLHGKAGMTWKELAAHFGWHHGSASGVLSSLHKQSKVVRLRERRDGAAVYVMPQHVDGRPTRPRARPTNDLTDDLAVMLRRLYRPCKHDPMLTSHPTCRACEIRELLARYDREG